MSYRPLPGPACVFLRKVGNLPCSHQIPDHAAETRGARIVVHWFFVRKPFNTSKRSFIFPNLADLRRAERLGCGDERSPVVLTVNQEYRLIARGFAVHDYAIARHITLYTAIFGRLRDSKADCRWTLSPTALFRCAESLVRTADRPGGIGNHNQAGDQTAEYRANGSSRWRAQAASGNGSAATPDLSSLALQTEGGGPSRSRGLLANDTERVFLVETPHVQTHWFGAADERRMFRMRIGVLSICRASPMRLFIACPDHICWALAVDGIGWLRG
jgi:hypothetical protein